VESIKAQKGMGMEGVVAKWYAATTRNAIGEFKALARRVAEISPGPEVLEVAPGPGYFAIELAKLGGFRVTGVDISKTFVQIARKNAAKAGVSVEFQNGNAAAVPFPADRFDFILCRAAFKNFAEPVRALSEMYRVLRPAGEALIIDLRRDASQTEINQAVDQMELSSLNRTMNKLIFRFMLLKRAYTKAEFRELVAQTPFQRAGIIKSSIALEVSLRKQSSLDTALPQELHASPGVSAR